MRTQHEIDHDFSAPGLLDRATRFFLVGIGGAGMSGLAMMLKRRGFDVSGSDSTRSEVTEDLERQGISVRLGHSDAGIEPGMAMVLSDAIPTRGSPEVDVARRLGLDLFRRSQLLEWVLRDRKMIAVTGTHGKTTTTGMIGAALIEAGLDPTIVVGASVPQWGGAVVEGAGEWAVVEACEAYNGFHDLTPDVIVLTNLELDHVDFHQTYEGLLDNVGRFVRSLPEAGLLLYHPEDRGSVDASQNAGRLGASPDPWAGDLATPGEHNRQNAALALAAALAAGADADRAKRGIAAFRGAERRLQVLREGPVTVVDDYAHHPSEIEASLRALRERYSGRRLIVVYQPHLYTRTADLIPEFAAALDLADEVVLTDIYPAREDPIPGVSSARIAERVTQPVRYEPCRFLLPMALARRAQPNDLIVGMGAGNIAEFGPALLKELDREGPLRVCVAYGGDSAEREVSLLSGRAVLEALEARGYRASLLDVSERLLKSGDLSSLIGPERPDVVFLAVHGQRAEDGAIQGLCELLHLPYTGSGVQASALAMDKQKTKTLLEAAAIPTPRGVAVRSADASVPFDGPWVVKPNAQGSTVGLSFVQSHEELRGAIDRALKYDDVALVEEQVVGMEVSVPVLGDRALPVVEIAPASGRYDFEAKYTPGATEEIVPARLTDAMTALVQRYAVEAHRALGCTGLTRTDIIVRGTEAVVLEVNTLPGLTGTSLAPNSAAAAGMSFSDLVEWIVQEALARHARQA